MIANTFYFVKALLVYLLTTTSAYLFAQAVPQHYTEDFSESFPVRKQQHLESLFGFLDKHLK